MTLYFRSYLITLGLLFLGGGMATLLLDAAGKLSLTIGPAALAVLVVLAGAMLFMTGILAPAHMVERWADRASVHEGSLLIGILALPLFLVLKCLRRTGKSAGNGHANEPNAGSKRSRRRNPSSRR